MAINSLNFLNKNQFRSYPLKAGSLLTAIDGKKITNELFVGISVSTTIDRKNLFISQVSANAGNLSVTIAAEMANGYTESLGSFTGVVTKDFTTLKLTSYLPFTSGSIIIGSFEAASKLSGVYAFDKETLQLEESTVFYYTPPPVTSLVHENTYLKGNVKFGILNNLVKSRDENNILFGVIDSLSVSSLADQHSAFNNCNTPIIRYIDGAVPFYDTSGLYPELQGNLFMVGVAPIVFYGQQGESTVDGNNLPVYNGNISTGTVGLNGKPLTLDNLCATSGSVLPPISPVYIHNLPNDITTSPVFKGNEHYYTKSRQTPSNFITATEPEFTWWPQFLSSISPLSAIAAVEGEQKVIGTAPQFTTGNKKLIGVSLSNSNSTNITLNILKNGEAVPGMEGLILGPHQSITTTPSEITEVAPGDTFDVYFSNVSGGNSFLIPYILYR